MKKLLTIFSAIFLMMLTININVNASSSDEDILYRYGTNTPVKFYDNRPVTLPKEYKYPNQEFRAVWICTIWNLDVPKHGSQAAFKNNFIQTLDILEEYNINVLIYQVRPKNDAFYESELNPWSRFLTGVEGRNPGWDPLPWMIEETHKRGMEFHAWFNPYRVFVDEQLAPNNFAKLHPEYVMNIAKGEEIFNPGIPEVQNFIIDTVVEVAEKYDIDGVHFDDYFYPYAPLADYWDNLQFKDYNPKKLSRDDWRRENVNIVVRGVKDELTRINNTFNKAIQFGISPYGVWANYSSDTRGSYTNNIESYSLLYADTYTWIKEEWIDYVVPQLYFEFTTPSAPYADIVEWWANVVKGTKVNLYTGQSIYRYVEGGWNTGPWEDPNELGNQIRFNNKYSAIQGAVYFRYNNLKLFGNQNLQVAQNALKNEFYKYKVLPPANLNINVSPVSAPEDLKLDVTSNGYKLTWKKDQNAKAYYVYRFESTVTKNALKDIKNVVGIVRPDEYEQITFIDQTAEKNVSYNYYVTPFNKANVEGSPSNISNINNINIFNAQVSLNKYQQYSELISSNVEAIKEVKALGDLITNNLTLINDKTTTFINDLAVVEVEKANLSVLIETLFKDYNEDTKRVKDLKISLKDVKTKSEALNSKINQLHALNQEINQLKTTTKDSIKTFNIKYPRLLNINNLQLDTLNTYHIELKTSLDIINEEKKNLNDQNLIDLINNVVNIAQIQLNQLNVQKNALQDNTQIYNNLPNTKERISTDQANIDLIDEYQEEYDLLTSDLSLINENVTAINLVIDPLIDYSLVIMLSIAGGLLLIISGATVFFIKKRSI